MAFIVEQKIKGTTYVYKSVGYWDKEKKQARHKRICLGKKDPKTGKLIPSKSQVRPRGCRDYGNFHLLNTIAERSGLTDVVKETFPDLWEEILTCAFYEISERKPLYLCGPWSESTETPAKTILSSQRISELLHELGRRDRDRMRFFRTWAKKRAEHECLALDITSISSYSKMNKFLEFGYNRDGDNLPQINLAMLFGETSLLPVFYTTIQGSIRDMTSLTNILRYAKELDVEKVRFVMDKGFYSDNNIKEMLKKRLKFAVSVPFTTKLAKKLVDTSRRNINTPAKSFIVNNDLVYGEKRKVTKHSKRLQAFVYFNERQRIDSKESLLRRIMSLEHNLAGKKKIPRSLSNTCRKYLILRRSKNGLLVRRNEQMIENSLRYKGFVVIISNTFRDKAQCLHIYRSKDAVERAFDNMKNELDMKRLRVHSELSMNGRTFLAFISLILHSSIDKVMKEKDLYKKFTQEEVMCELKRLKIIELTRHNTLTEISKAQSFLFRQFEIPLPRQTLL